MHWSVLTDPNRPINDAKTSQRITSVSAILVGVLCLIACPFLILNGALLLGWLLLPVTAIYASVVVLNYFDRPKLAIWVLFLNFNVGTFFYLNILGHTLGMEYLFLASIVVSQLVFKTLTTKVISGLVVIFLVVIGDFNLLIKLTPMTLDETSEFWIRTATLPGALIIIISAVVVSYVRYDQQAAAMSKAITMARTDELTGLGNRFSFKQDTIHELIKQTPNCALIFFDLNGLKEVNDQQGHKSGDNYLIGFALQLKKHFPTARIYRFGGDEFVAWLQETHGFLPQLEQLISRLNKDDDHKRGVSYGMARGEDAKSIDQMIELADNRMYRQKNETRDS